MEKLPDLGQLIAWVEQPDRDSLDLVTDAVILSGRLGELGDGLIDHFVQQARENGASWAEIGQSMGVSKQAAQKRFVGEERQHFKLAKGGLFTRFAGDARSTVQAAVGHAQQLRSSDINTLHLVMALADDQSGRAHGALSALAASPAAMAASARTALEGPTRPRSVKHLPFAADAKKVLELSLREAIRSETRQIRTEHILLGLLRDDRSRGAVVLIEHGLTHPAVETWLKENPVSDR